MLVKHRFSERLIPKSTEIIIIGTFNPDTPENKADFFYGRTQNHLWTLLPEAFGETSLKTGGKEAKARFMAQHKIDFMDVIQSVDVEKPDDYRDDYIDACVVEWTDVVGQLRQLPALRKVCITRKTVSGIPNIRKRFLEIELYCRENKIQFQYLITPARGYTVAKQEEWNAFFTGDFNQNKDICSS